MPSSDPSRPAESVSVTGARLRFAGTLLFDGLALTVEAGTWTCLLGPSGVGKTSLLRVLAGLATLEAGHTDARPENIAYMAQQDFLLPWRSVLGNVVHGARLRGETPDLARARALLDEVGLADRARSLPATLSGGMRQRVALARTLMEDRPVVLMDEPFSALDAITRLRLQALAARLLRGRTILLVTHDPLEALRLGEHIYIMSGKPARLAAAPLPPGAPPREPSDAAVLAAHAELLRRLVAADARHDRAS